MWISEWQEIRKRFLVEMFISNECEIDRRDIWVIHFFGIQASKR